jgi:hypothetical protein
MIFAFLLLATGLTISAVAIYYSVIGLTSIFAAAFWPVVIMGATLEVAKLVAASWLKAEWSRIPRLLKTYLTSAVVVLMLITSMGIFGFLSKAHLDQSVISGDVVDKISLFDEKIKTQRDNIDASKKALAQMDAQVDQVLGRSTDEKGAERAVQIRRNQAKERERLQKEISNAQSQISKLNEERAPIAKDLRAVEAEVGPIKYIAKLIYGDNSDANVLEKAVTWVIILIVLVFDPLAVLLLISAQMAWLWHKEKQVADPEPQETEYVHAPWPFPVNDEIARPITVDSTEQTVDEKQRYDSGDIEDLPASTVEKFDEEKLQTPTTDIDVPILENEELWASNAIDEEESKKKTYMIKEQGQQVIKTKD